jgi:hypothetical protein
VRLAPLGDGRYEAFRRSGWRSTSIAAAPTSWSSGSSRATPAPALSNDRLGFAVTGEREGFLIMRKPL